MSEKEMFNQFKFFYPDKEGLVREHKTNGYKLQLNIGGIYYIFNPYTGSLKEEKDVRY